MAMVRMWRFWERCSVTAVRRSHHYHLAHRLWALMSGFWHWDGGRIRLALSEPSPATGSALTRFVAERLSKRPDVQAQALLAEWLADTCETRRQAAREAVTDLSGQAAQCG